MPQLPNTYGRRQTPTPQRTVKGYSTRAYEQANLQAARNLENAGREMGDFAEQRYQEQEKDAIINAQERENYAKRQVMDVLYGTDEKEGLYSRKGSNALNMESDFESEWETIRNTAMNGVENPAARKALEKSLDGLYTSNLGSVKRYRSGERRSYFGELSSTRAQLATEQAGLEWNNAESFNTALADVEKSARNSAMSKGLSTEGVGLAVRDARSGVYLTRIAAMINTDNPAVMSQAAVLYDTARQKGQLTFDAVTKLDKMIDAVMPKVNAANQFEKFRSGLEMGQQGTEPIFNAMLQVESGGQHYLPNGGGIVTSHAGAKGIAQLMPATAKEVAEEMGIDPSTWLVPEINATLGKAYLEKMQKQFGDNTLAVLAYNWGPGSVQEHMKKVGDPRTGDISMDYFLATIDNDEARQYVPKVMSAMGGPMDMLNMDKAMAAADNMPEDERKEFIKLVENQNSEIERDRMLQAKSLLDDAIAFIEGNGKGTESMPTAMLTRANNLGMYKELSEYTGKTDPNTADFLYGLPPKELKELDLNTPGIRLKLSPQDYEKWTKKQESLDDSAKMVTAERRNRMVNDAFAKQGLSTRTDEGIGRKNRLNELIDLEIDAFAQQHNGRYPNLGEMQGLVDDLVIKGDYDTNWWWGRGGNQFMFDIELDEIPKKERQKIKEALQARGMPITESQIIRTFMLGKKWIKEQE